jgi:hypothetical protein
VELIEVLQKKLGLEEEQAKGGASVLFRLAKERLRIEDFSRVAHYVPDIDEMIEAAPEFGGPVSSFSGLGSAIGGEIAAPDTLSSLADEFSKLGLDTRRISKFVSLVLKDLRSKGGERTKLLLEKALR